MNKKWLNIFLILLTATLYCSDVLAQCAMCRATAESATENVNKGIGEGLNSGIVYLMIIPYLLLGAVGFVFFRKRIFQFFRG